MSRLHTCRFWIRRIKCRKTVWIMIIMILLLFNINGNLDEEILSSKYNPKITPYEDYNSNGKQHNSTMRRMNKQIYLYSQYTNTEILNISVKSKLYFVEIDSGVACFIQGTDLPNSIRNCKCQADYFGKDCGIPAAAWYSFFKNNNAARTLRRRVTPRRVIHGMQVNHELLMFETRLHELNNTVDVFVIVEANHTDYGDPKPLIFLDKLNEGYFSEFRKKILYIFVDSAPPNAKENNWKAHDYMRSFLGPQSLSRINGLRDDDLFLVTDADEIPSNEIMTFLKLYNGYYEHVCFTYRWNIYGFYWKKENNELTKKCSVASIKILRKMFNGNTWMIRTKIDARAWWAGTMDHYAGWHCSWCFSPEGIVQKMDSAIGADRPRWGDYPEKKNLTYIMGLIQNGRWFDDKGRFVYADTREPMFAPNYLMKNSEIYEFLLLHPSKRNKNIVKHM